MLMLTAVLQYAQDQFYATAIIDTLSAPIMWGRGYTHDGLDKAADYIAGEFKNYDIAPLMGSSYFQDFEYGVNTFPGEMKLTIDGKELKPGEDFIVGVNSPSMTLINKSLQKIDSNTYVYKDKKNTKVQLQIVDKLTWSVGRAQEDIMGLTVLRSAIDGLPMSKLSLDIEAVFIDDFKTKNVCGIVKGTQYPDSFLLVTAHYDHLGGMGYNTYFPGANDNASGVAMLLDLASYYAMFPLPYSVVFIAFSGEEIGLLGSKHFVYNSPIPLSNIAFVMNLDLMGNGADGITVVNATVFPDHFSLLEKVNKEDAFIETINQRGKAANSDHYFFSEMGIPAFFIYTQGGAPYYHDVQDRAEVLPMTLYNEVFKLIDRYFGALSGR